MTLNYFIQVNIINSQKFTEIVTTKYVLQSHRTGKILVNKASKT